MNAANDIHANESNTRHLYLLWFLLCVLVLGALVGAFNAAADPQARLLFVDRPGFNQIKIGLQRNSRKGKTTALRQCNYDTIVVGTSRAETAIGASHPVLRDAAYYNAALRAGTMYEMRRMAEYAAQQHDLEVVLVSLDYESFNDAIPFAEDFPESPLAERATVSSYARYLFSLQTFWQSVATFRWNIRDKTPDCEDRGEHRRTYALEAARRTFDYILRVYATGHYGEYVPGDRQIQHLADLLRELADADVEVYAFISPVHVVQNELMAEMGLIDDYYEWKRNLVRVFSEVNRDLPQQQHAALWDFSGYSEITTEKVPSPDGEKYMRWYTDPSHFTKDVGNLMIDRMFRLQPENVLIAEPFGVQLTSANVEKVIEAEKRGSERYRHDNSDEISRLRKMLESVP